MAFDEANGVAILFGGHGNVTGATGLTYDSNETWAWTGSRWVQRFPLVSPPARYGHVMVYDSKRGRIVLFGGRAQKPSLEDNAAFIFFNDTWVWENGNWRRIETAHAPTPRYFSGAAYDRVRDRVILFGGNEPTSDVDVDDPVNDTWEFDGTDWISVGGTQPDVAKPNLGYDIARNTTYMLGVNDKLETQMYIYDGATRAWTQHKPQTLPPCVNEGAMTYLSWPRKLGLIYMGGLCRTDESTAEKVYLWDGANWIDYPTNLTISRATGIALTFDNVRNKAVMFGGQLIFSNIRSTTYTLDSDWHFEFGALKPGARSQMVFRGDPVNNTVWLFGGLEEYGDSYNEDFWGYRNGSWFQVPTQDKSPTNCGAPYSTYDTTRGRLLVSCVGEDLYEWDGTTWKFFDDVKDNPDGRRFSSMVYDENLKKVVLFGGFDGEDYLRDTWTWDGTNWTEVKPDNSRRPEHRGIFQMWYDGNLKKTVIYSGLGRPDLDARITRYSDMWAFDGSGWTKLNPSTTPGERFGAAVARHPDTNKVYLFGGLYVEKEGDVSKRQYFSDDTW
ncbi:MAG TPA: kelch repeat-containing protein, partial [Thermoanaerobaculia bacterium]